MSKYWYFYADTEYICNFYYKPMFEMNLEFIIFDAEETTIELYNEEYDEHFDLQVSIVTEEMFEEIFEYFDDYVKEGRMDNEDRIQSLSSEKLYYYLAMFETM